MNKALYRKINDRTQNSSTYHKKDGTSVRAVLKKDYGKMIERCAGCGSYGPFFDTCTKCGDIDIVRIPLDFNQLKQFQADQKQD